MEKTFYANGRDQVQFFAEINGWFAANRNIIVNDLYIKCKSRFGLLVNKSSLSEITLIYSENGNVSNLYGIDYNESFSLMKVNLNKMKSKWIANNPHLQYICSNYMHNARGQAGSLMLNGIGANNRNQIWIIYRVPEASRRPDLQPPAQNIAPAAPTADGVCPNCSYNNGIGSNFCAACGFKIK